MLELIARIRAVLRRSQPAQSVREYRLGPLYVCPEQHIVRVDGQDVTLTNKEFELLCLLLDNQGLVLTRQVLMDRVWGAKTGRWTFTSARFASSSAQQAASLRRFAA